MDQETPQISISQLTSEFCLAQFNDSRKYYLNYLVHAKWIWKSLFKETQNAIISVYVQVDKSTLPYSIKLRKDSVKFLNISVEDIHGNMYSLLMDNAVNEIPLPSGDTCPACGETDELTKCVQELTTVTENVIIFGGTYYRKTWKKVFKNGDIYEYAELPAVDYDTSGNAIVKVVKTSKFIAQLQVKPCGCLSKDPGNIALLNRTCGSLSPTLLKAQLGCCIKEPNKMGKIKVANGRVYFTGWVPDRVILTYVTNGDCGGEELMVPESAVTAVMFGIKWRSSALAPSIKRLDSRQAKADYDTQVQEYEQYQNPIRVEEFMSVQMSIPKWGQGEDDYCGNIGDLKANDENMKPCDNSVNYNTVTVNNNYVSYNSGASGGGTILPPFVQSTPLDTWTYHHNLGYNPVVNLTDLNDVSIGGVVDFSDDKNTIVVSFNTARTGKIYLAS